MVVQLRMWHMSMTATLKISLWSNPQSLTASSSMMLVSAALATHQSINDNLFWNSSTAVLTVNSKLCVQFNGHWQLGNCRPRDHGPFWAILTTVSSNLCSFLCKYITIIMSGKFNNFPLNLNNDFEYVWWVKIHFEDFSLFSRRFDYIWTWDAGDYSILTQHTGYEYFTSWCLHNSVISFNFDVE